MNQFFKKQLQMFFSGREEFVNAEYIGRAVYVKLDKDLKCKAEFVTRGVHEQYEALRLETFNNERKIDSLTLNFSEYFKPYKLGNGGSRTPHIWHDCQKYEWYGTPTAEDRQRLANEVCQYIRMNSSDQVINQRHEKCEAISKIEEFEAKLEGLSECDSTPSFQSDVTLGCPTHLNVSWADGKAWLSLHMCVYDSSSPDELLPFEKACADFGVRECTDVAQFNAILAELGREAEEYCMEENEEDEAYEEEESEDETEVESAVQRFM